MAFIARAIKSERTRRDDAVRTQVLSVLRKYERKMVKDFEKTTQTWTGETPTFDSKISFPRVGKEMSIWAGAVNDGSFGWRKFNWINKGTNIRWALLSGPPDQWMSKTLPGRLEAREGQGKVLIAGRAMIEEGYPPEPGLEARDFDKQIRELHLKDFQKDMKAAIARGLRRSGK
jgi:hypothetical protein